MNKILFSLIASILFFALTLTTISNETVEAKTIFGKVEVKKGMIGKVVILKDTYQYSISSKNLKKGAKLKKGTEYGIYSYSKKYGGIYKMGSNKYVKKNSAIKYYKIPKDITAPLAPTINEVTDKSTRVTGTAEVESKITVKAGMKVIGTATTLRTGGYSVKISKQKAGTKLSVTATDSAGNVSAMTQVTVKVKEMIKYTTYNLKNGILLSYTNLDNISQINTDIRFYDSDDKLVYIGRENQDNYTAHLKKGDSRLMTFEYPPQDVTYSYYKINFEFLDHTNFIANPVDELEGINNVLDSNSKEINIQVKNNSQYYIQSGSGGYVIFYEENTPVAFIDFNFSAMNINQKQETTINYSKLIDVNFDSYKVFINQALTWD